ncbi:MAG: glycosyltransferase [Verrucomicrobia bacterium]|nr:glycosyltransferase [Verrucomicrobiota bacterium]
MRIAYIAPYHGPTLVKRRPIIINRSLAGATKIELIAKLLRVASHEVEVISQGEVVQLGLQFYPSFHDPELFDSKIPVWYSSALPIRFLNGRWSSFFTMREFKKRHTASPYDVVIIYNMKDAQLACASYARRCGVPVILEYEDDVFVDVGGEAIKGFRSKGHSSRFSKALKTISGCIAVSPHLLSQVSSHLPKLLLRGVVGDDIVRASERSDAQKLKWVLFSGTHRKSKGIEQLVQAWKILARPDWELHITGYGETTDVLKRMAEESRSIVFHGLVERAEFVRLLSLARICINPHDLSQTPGNVFAFKIIEYLAAGAHVLTTPMGALEREVEEGLTYLPDNDPETIGATLNQVIESGRWERNAAPYVCATYGSAQVSRSLDCLISQVLQRASQRNKLKRIEFASST